MKRGKTAIVDDKRELAELLINGNLDNISPYLKNKLHSAGYVKFEKVDTGNPGRPPFRAIPTSKARNFMARALMWRVPVVPNHPIQLAQPN